MYSLVMYSNYFDWNHVGYYIRLKEATFQGMFVFTTVSLHYKMWLDFGKPTELSH